VTENIYHVYKKRLLFLESNSGDTSYEEAISLQSRQSVSLVSNLMDKIKKRKSSSSSSTTMKSVESPSVPARTFSPDQFAKNVDDFRASIEEADTVVIVADEKRKTSSSSSSSSDFDKRRRLNLYSQTSLRDVIVVEPMKETVPVRGRYADAVNVRSSSKQPVVFTSPTPVYAAEYETVLQPEFETVYEVRPLSQHTHRYSQSSEASSEVMVVGHTFHEEETVEILASGSSATKSFVTHHGRQRSSSSSSSSSASSGRYSDRGTVHVAVRDEIQNKSQERFDSSRGSEIKMATRVSVSSTASEESHQNIYTVPMGESVKRRTPSESSSDFEPVNSQVKMAAPIWKRTSSESSHVSEIKMATRVSVSSYASDISSNHDKTVHLGEHLLPGKLSETSSDSETTGSQVKMAVPMGERVSSESSRTSEIKVATTVSVLSDVSDKSRHKSLDDYREGHLKSRKSSASSYNSESANSQIKMATRVSVSSSASSDTDAENAGHPGRQRTSSGSSATSQIQMATRISVSSDNSSIEKAGHMRRRTSSSSSSSSSSSEATPSHTIAEANLSIPLSQQIFSSIGSDLAFDSNYTNFRTSKTAHYEDSVIYHKENGQGRHQGWETGKMNGTVVRDRKAEKGNVKKVDILPTSSSDLSTDDEDHESQEFRNTIMNFDLENSLLRSYGGAREPVIMRPCTRVSEKSETSLSTSSEEHQRSHIQDPMSTESGSSGSDAGGRINGNGVNHIGKTDQMVYGGKLEAGTSLRRKSSGSPVPSSVFRQVTME
jgi:hypothetical protein